MIKSSRLINNLSTKKYISILSKYSNNSINNAVSNSFKSSLNNSRSFHSTNQSYFLFETLDKLKNVFGGDKKKKEYPNDQKDLEDKTKSNLEKQNDSSSTVSTTSTKEAPQMTEEQKKAQVDKQNEEYIKFLESDAKYDFNVFRDSLIQYCQQLKDQERKKEAEAQIKIIDCMTPKERENPYVFHKNAFKLRARIIKDSNTDIQTFASMVNAYNSAKMINEVLRNFKKQGKPVPKNVDEFPTFFKSNAVEIRDEFNKIKASESRKF